MSATEPAAPRSRLGTTLLAVLALAATLIAGIIIGFAGDRLLTGRSMHRRPPRMAEFLVKRLDRKLDLSPQQEAEIEKILRRGEQRISAAWGEVRPQVRREIERTNAEIERVLTPEQRAEFQKIKMRIGPRHGRRGERPPRP